MKNSHIPIAKPIIGRDVRRAVNEVLRSGNLTQGPEVLAFEREFSLLVNERECVAVNSGTSALHIALLSLGIGVGDEVIVPSFTFAATANSVALTGAKPVFVDIDIKTYNIDPNLIEKAITPNTKAIFLTHVLGINGLTDELLDICEKNNILLIEDVCESHGAKHNGRKVGTFGFASNFSYYYAHHMTTIEGGMVSTNDSNFYESIRMMRSHGLLRESTDLEFKSEQQLKHPDLNKEFIFMSIGHNMRPTEINGILGIEQLTKLSHNVQVRNSNFEIFLSNLDSNLYKTDFKVEGCSNYAFTLVLNKADFRRRDKIEEVLNAETPEEDD